MRSNNPVLSKPDTWQVPAQTQAYPGQTYAQPGAYPPPGYGDPNAAQFAPAPVTTDRMTIEDVLTKSAVTIGTLAAVAVLTFLFLPPQFLFPAMIVGAIGSFVPVLFVSFRRTVNPAFVLAYAAIEGVFIGAVSALYEGMWNGIVPAALAGTVFAAAATLGAYKFFRIKVTSKFRKMVIIGTMAYAGLLLVNFVLSFFGLAFITAGTMTVWALLFSAIGIGLAVFNLIMDFDYIEQGIAMGAPASESWRGAFGLTVTLVWLYVELLRLLSYFRN
ncbi:MAG: Bax inhibitor-1/YccA family protein [Propionibacteriaceae bacterium]|jgi:uncharacterized YccA/Bax inhibitor family protein|nr:Bax inhibitor-1/YccA family protein [Propionibacteriaceae bacterium]